MANQHFFKPLLPGFHSHLKIPLAFFFKNIKGKNDHKTAELRSEVSEKTWKVKLENGRRFTDGWKEFALAHDLRIGDIVVFRQDKDMTFHVSVFGPSCCEIQYETCLNHQNNIGKIIQREKKERKTPRRETESSFVANVLSSTLRYDRLNLPRSFVRANGLDTRCGEIVLMNAKGRSWSLDLKGKKSTGVAYIRRGWRSFCTANGLKAGDFFKLKLIQRGKTMVLCVECSEANEIVSLSTEPESDEQSSEDEMSPQECSKRTISKASSSASQSRFVKITLTPYNIRLSKIVLPIPFTKVNGIKKAKTISLLDKQGVKWSTDLQFEKGRKRMRLVGGWKEFCEANCVKIGESIMLELIWEADRRNSVLKFCSKVKPETN